jgi:hypothetical protein
VIEINPPQLHRQVQLLCSAGLSFIRTLAAPGVHGVTVTGMQGCGVSTPLAAAVAEATWGFVGVVHMPNGVMFVIGW